MPVVHLPPVFLIYAARHALAHARDVADITAALVADRDQLPDPWRHQLVRDIDTALAGTPAGTPADILCWRWAQHALDPARGTLMTDTPNIPDTDEVPAPTTEQWCVFHGGPDPDNAAGTEIHHDEADAYDDVRWRRLNGRLARRTVTYGPWQVVPPPYPDSTNPWNEEPDPESVPW